MSELFWNVTAVKTLLLLLGFVLYAGLVLSIDRFRDHSTLHLGAYALVVGQAYLPVWLFLGLERMKHITLLNVLAKVIYVVLVFSVIREPADFETPQRTASVDRITIHRTPIYERARPAFLITSHNATSKPLFKRNLVM